jgi:3-isopropylmalate/(R)-2-methylmalate dehydratase small subunit
MEPFRTLTSLAMPLDRTNVDTDQIIPKQFLKRIERTGYGEFLFFDWRYNQGDGKPNPEFILNQPQYKGASILIAGKNFGSGSSREHAAWALDDFGFRSVIAPSFADIYFNNAGKNGIVNVRLSETEVAELQKRAAQPGYQLTVSLIDKTVRDNAGFKASFEVDEFRRHCLMEGLDDIGLTLRHADDITKFETQRAARGW